MTGKDAAGVPTGPLRDFAEGVKGVDLILGDHTDVQFEGRIGDALVVENRSKGATYSKTQLTVDPAADAVTAAVNQFVVPTAANVAPDQAIVDLLKPYRDLLTPILSGVIGTSNRAIPRSDSCGRSDSRLCESLVGNVITDAMLSQTPGADFAITNSGGLRDALTCPVVDNPLDFCPAFTPPPYPITRGQVRSTLSFGNILASASLNGAELKAYLEHGVSAMPAANGRFAQVSGLCMTYDVSKPTGSRVLGAVRQAADGSCTGLPVTFLASSTYTVAINDFMANGGDGYPNVAARMATLDPLDAAAIRHIAAETPLSPAIQGRIVCTTTGATPCPVVTAP
jgi:2',3'-cyclic-nucleotide 2'-phosphodiesterase (5'-nucleotidase family)